MPPAKLRLFLPDPASPSHGAKPSRTPTGKTTRLVPRTTRRVAGEAPGDDGALIAFAAAEAKAKNQLLLFGSIGAGAILLLLIIAIAASSGSSGRPTAGSQRSEYRAVAAPPPPPPEPPRQYNYLRNTGSIVFVCGGTDKHQDREVVLSVCPKCAGKNGFAWDEGAAAYRCSSCKGVYENSALKCDRCERSPRVTHLKKVTSSP